MASLNSSHHFLQHYTDSIELADQACNPGSVDWPYDYMVDMDEITRALLELIPGEEIPTKTCKLILGGWNFLDDLLHTMDMPRTYEEQNSEDINHSYERIFWGNNLEALTPSSESWHPEFSKDEIISVQGLFFSILETLEQKQVI
jgi:hypothetical protein